MRDLMSPLFQLLGAATMIIFVVVNLRTRKTLKDLPSRLQFGAMICVSGGLLFMGMAASESGLRSAAPGFVGAGGFFFAAALLVAAGLWLSARSHSGKET